MVEPPALPCTLPLPAVLPAGRLLLLGGVRGHPLLWLLCGWLWGGWLGWVLVGALLPCPSELHPSLMFLLSAFMRTYDHVV